MPTVSKQCVAAGVIVTVTSNASPAAFDAGALNESETSTTVGLVGAASAVLEPSPTIARNIHSTTVNHKQRFLLFIVFLLGIEKKRRRNYASVLLDLQAKCFSFSKLKMFDECCYYIHCNHTYLVCNH